MSSSYRLSGGWRARTFNDLIYLLFSFNGRIGRQSFWLGYLGMLIVAMALAVAPVLIFGKGQGAQIWAVLIVFFAIAAGFAISVKRLHDRDKSGWWMVLFYIIPSAFDRIAQSSIEGSGSWWMATLISLVLSIWGLIEVGFRPARADIIIHNN